MRSLPSPRMRSSSFRGVEIRVPALAVRKAWRAKRGAERLQPGLCPARSAALHFDGDEAATGGDDEVDVAVAVAPVEQLALAEATRQYAKMSPFFVRLLALEPEKTHYGVQAKYYQFLADGSLASFAALDHAIRNVRQTDRCDMRTVQNREMAVAMVNDDFQTYARNWEGKWERHQRGHGQWSCPGQLNDEANHAHLLMARGQTALAKTIVERAKHEAPLPYTEMSMRIFDRDAFRPKLAFMSGNREVARREFDEAVVKIMRNRAFPRGSGRARGPARDGRHGPPDRVYSIYREITGDPVSLLGLEAVCANPWTYPNLLKDPRFVAEVRRDGRFVEFLEKHGWFERGA